MKKAICILLVTACILGCLTGCGKDSDTIDVGFLVHITGDSALWGQAERDGAQIAVDEINANGGILGKQAAFLHRPLKSGQIQPGDGLGHFLLQR